MNCSLAYGEFHSNICLSNYLEFCLHLTALFPTCTHPKGSCFNLACGLKVKRNLIYLLRPKEGNAELPTRWFMLCGLLAFSYIPECATSGPCAIGRLLVPWKGTPEVQDTRPKHSLVLDKTCNSHVSLLTVTEAGLLAGFLVGVPGLSVGNIRNIDVLACLVVKGMNKTSKALNNMLQDLKATERATIQNRMAIDYLLLKANHGCETFEGMCCLNLSDHSQTIESHIKKLQDMAKQITISNGWFSDFFGWVGDWFHEFGIWTESSPCLHCYWDLDYCLHLYLCSVHSIHKHTVKICNLFYDT
ncbi:uncharacterized protein LOC129341350 [Eublepharis macularius]|uniref:Uncharacterized protein LOC129341350 n=1 Tax=Eublepharis macularius TaxID=481883 RepID=A0AA97K958_EUBMA|nr:uncharacterized protein LOC129341350 [Eublepharis macularius]XP_054852472.1 uncharacterized protein LOC129341350 [Eublepharis macularius]XP_054852473.1 uncharacterized protein LOC129341350 [Eublepharis macularius]